MKKLTYFCMCTIFLIVFTGCLTDDDNNEEVKPLKVVVLGDSISEGCNPDISTYDERYAEKYGWAQMIVGETYEGIDPVSKTIYDINENIDWDNFAITGSKASEWNADTSSNTIWKVWDNEFQKVLDANADLVIVYIGANDIRDYMEDGSVSEGEWSALRFDIEGIIDQIQAENVETNILMIGYYDVFDGLSQNLEETAYSFYTGFSSVTQEGNALLEEIATTKGVEYLSIEDEFMHHCYGKFLGDPMVEDPLYVTDNLMNFDVHPATEGHKQLYNTILNKLEIMLENQN